MFVPRSQFICVSLFKILRRVAALIIGRTAWQIVAFMFEHATAMSKLTACSLRQNDRRDGRGLRGSARGEEVGAI